MKVSDTERERIKAAVTKAELNTSGEVVPVIVSRSDFYAVAHFRLAMITAMVFALVSYYFYDFLDPIFLIYIQVPGLILGYALTYIPFVKRVFITKNEVREEVRQRAIEIFHNQQVSATKDRTGIMIYISLLERRVEVLADSGITNQLPADYWDILVRDLTSNIKQSNVTSGLEAAIMKCGASLSEKFPIQADDKNERPNELITD